MASATDVQQNDLLAALPDAELQRWLPHLELIDLPLGHVVSESGETVSNAYFPINAIVSLLYILESGASAEIAVVGKEGLIGTSPFMGGGSSPSRAVVQSGGRGWRLDAKTLQEESSTPVRSCTCCCAIHRP